MTYKVIPYIAAFFCFLCGLYLMAIREYLGGSVFAVYFVHILWGDAISDWVYRRFYARKDKSA